MFFQSMQMVGGAMGAIFFIGALGFFLIRKKILSDEGLDALGRLAIDVTFPLLVVYQIVKSFSFSKYPQWWLFPLLSIGVTLAGMGVGWLFGRFLKKDLRVHFMSLVAYQNSGYLPLALFGGLLAGSQREEMFIYLFLFLISFNLVMFSIGAHMLAASKKENFSALKFLSPPVVATIIGMLLVFFKLSAHVPEQVMKSLKLVGDCTLPLALLVVGGDLAAIRLRSVNIKAMSLMVAGKLLLLPVLGLVLISYFKLPHLIGLLILIELAVPPAINLSVLSRGNGPGDQLISQGIFFGHITSMLTLPVFLSVYFTYYMV